MKLVQLPISAQIMALINKYKLDANQEYIFPIMDDPKVNTILSFLLQLFYSKSKLLAKRFGKDLKLGFRIA